jgi:hypothetical protein
VSATTKEVIKNSTLPIIIPQKWEKVDELFTSDEVIDAYFNGMSVGKDQTRRLLVNQFKENVEKATGLAEKVYNAVAEKGFNPTEIHLKANQVSNFNALIVVTKEDFINPEFDKIYSVARKVRKESESETFFLTLSFIPYSKELNESCLASDGYFLKYDKRPVPLKTRRS